MAYISIITSRQVAQGNGFTVNGSNPVRIIGGGCDTYKLKDGSYKVTICSANGQAWECEADLNVRRASSACLNIRVAVDNDGNITDMEYATFYLNTQQEGAYMFFPKLKLTYPAPTEKKEERLDDFDSLDDSDTLEEDVSVQSSAGNVAAAPKSGTGWIVAGVLFLIAGLANTGNIKVLIGGCVIGAILLFIGINKKKKA